MKPFQKIYFSFVVIVISLTLLSQGFVQVALRVQDEKFVLKKRAMIFRVDASFSDEEQNVIWKSLKNWEQATNNYVEFGYYTEEIPFGEAFRWKEDGVITIYNASSFFFMEETFGRL